MSNDEPNYIVEARKQALIDIFRILDASPATENRIAIPRALVDKFVLGRPSYNQEESEKAVEVFTATLKPVEGLRIEK